MIRTTVAAAFLAMLLSANASAADAAPAYIGKHASSPQDAQAINQVIADFQAAIRNKDSKLLSSLVVNPNILFESPMKPDDVVSYRKEKDADFDGLMGGGFGRFANMFKVAKDPLEEKFYNIKVTQDGNVAWVMFDFEFIVGTRVVNYGVEAWQMIKLPADQWKIASVVWTSNKPPK